MQKELNNIKIISNFGRIEFKLEDKILFSGVPFQDVVEFKDVEIKNNKILLTCLIKTINKTKDLVETKLIEDIREFDSSLFENVEEVSDEENSSDEDNGEESDDDVEDE